MTVARFDPSGKFVFIGTSAGTILVFNTRTKTVSFVSILPSPFSCESVDDRPTQDNRSRRHQRTRFCQVRTVNMCVLLHMPYKVLINVFCMFLPPAGSSPTRPIAPCASSISQRIRPRVQAESFLNKNLSRRGDSTIRSTRRHGTPCHIALMGSGLLEVCLSF